MQQELIIKSIPAPIDVKQKDKRNANSYCHGKLKYLSVFLSENYYLYQSKFKNTIALITEGALAELLFLMKKKSILPLKNRA